MVREHRAAHSVNSHNLPHQAASRVQQMCQELAAPAVSVRCTLYPPQPAFQFRDWLRGFASAKEQIIAADPVSDVNPMAGAANNLPVHLVASSLCPVILFVGPPG